MRIVAVVTNRSESYDCFMKTIHPSHISTIRFVKVDSLGRLNKLLPDCYVKLTISFAYDDTEAVVERLKSFAVPFKEAFDFTKPIKIL